MSTQTNMVLGRGLNDADYPVQKRGVTGSWRCPYYTAWYRMLATKDPVHDDWLLFSRFKRWMAKQIWEKRLLDRELLGDGKLFCESHCCFLDRATYKAVRDIKNGRVGGIDTPHGLKVPKPFRVTAAGKHHGYFETLKEAEHEWREARKDYIFLCSRKYSGRERRALIRLSGKEHGRTPRV